MTIVMTASGISDSQMAEMQMQSEPLTTWGVLKDSDARRTLLLTSFVLIAQVTCGIAAVEVYSASIFRRYYETRVAETYSVILASGNVVGIPLLFGTDRH